MPARWHCIVLLGIGSALPAHAQDIACGRSPSVASGGLDVRPGDGAEGVALDAPVIVRFLDEVDLDELERSLGDDVCGGELVCMFAEAGPRSDPRQPLDQPPAPVPGRVQRIDAGTVAFLPARRLQAQTVHFLLIARPGFDTGARSELELLTGQDRDREPPVLSADAAAIGLAVADLPARCGAPAGSRRVSLDFAAATDDGDPESVEHLLYLRGGPLREPSLRARARSERDTVRMSFALSPQEAAQPLCLVLKAVDGVGKVAEREPEICFDPASSNSFAPLCAASAGPGAYATRGRHTTLKHFGLKHALDARRTRRATDPTRTGAGAHLHG
jgi:hypothetical protein